MSQVYLIIFVALWSLSVLYRSLSYVYIWQVKEYRADRMRSFLRTGPGKQFFFDKFRALKLGLLILGLAAIYYLDWYYLLPILVYFLELGFIIKKRRLQKPDFTSKALLILALMLIFLIPNSILILLASPSLNLKILYLIGLDLLLPVISLFSILIQWPLSYVLKARTFKRAAAKRAAFPDLKVIGITGSYGKSSTKEFLATILSAKFKVLKTPKNVNSEMGIANFLLKNLSTDYEVLVVEMGAYKKGEIKKSCQIAKPQIGILTAVSQQHLDLFGSIENTKQAKYELISALPDSGFAVFNGDNKYTFELALKTRTPHAIYSVKDKADIWATEIQTSFDKIRFKLNGKELSEHLEARVFGKHNVSNLLAAIEVALHLGLDIQEIKQGLSKIEPLEKTLKVFTGIKEIKVIDDSYSANPDGVIAALDYLESFEYKQKIVLMPSLIELGRESAEIHGNLGKELARVATKVIITTADHYKDLIAELKTEDAEKFTLITKAKDIIAALDPILHKSTVVLIESRIPKSVIKYLTLN
ncbi:MAG: UDP-N-acetylmuramoyl-tripeptide--D-alanyl-D-alanine ligase [Candidatus Gracilibacteria bacterium]|nr:UDP-N-acetylmuramoyl-tripeptide--D-alanyl-D-alanine ligase [Candidatus Gracilibacteria bacterium]